MTSNLPFPAANEAQVYLDFDGTLTRWDTLDALILKYAVDESWHEIERQWQAGEIGSRACLSQEFGLVRITDAQLDAFLGTIEIDPALPALLTFLDQHQTPRAILSDGIDLFINRVLARIGRREIVRANTIRREGLHTILECPLTSVSCESAAAHCKCASMRALNPAGRQTIYIGDGRSDLCPARRADAVLAKGKLAEALASEGRAFILFDTLTDVIAILKQHWGEPA